AALGPVRVDAPQYAGRARRAVPAAAPAAARPGPHRLRTRPRDQDVGGRGPVRGGERVPPGDGARAAIRATRVDEHVHGARPRVRATRGDQAVAAPDGRASARVGLFAALTRAPWSFDFFHALRRIEALFTDRP